MPRLLACLPRLPWLLALGVSRLLLASACLLASHCLLVRPLSVRREEAGGLLYLSHVSLVVYLSCTCPLLYLSSICLKVWSEGLGAFTSPHPCLNLSAVSIHLYEMRSDTSAPPPRLLRARAGGAFNGNAGCGMRGAGAGVCGKQITIDLLPTPPASHTPQVCVRSKLRLIVVVWDAGGDRCRRRRGLRYGASTSNRLWISLVTP